MRVIFMGTPEFAVTALQALIDSGHEIAVVVTQPDRPQGRGLKLSASAVKEAALRLGIASERIYQPERLRKRQSLAPLLIEAVDLIVTVAYGQLLPKALLAHPRLAAINVHASLLPRYRGAAPLQRALMDGAAESGVTIMHMAERMDTGDMIIQRALPIDAEMNFGLLHDRLASLGAEALLEAVEALAAGRAKRIAQDESLASYAAMIGPEDRLLDWRWTTASLHNRIRALDPAPGAEAHVKGKRLKIWRSRVVPPIDTEKEPRFAASSAGEVVALAADGPLIRCGDGLLQLLEVQPSGKKRMAAAAWLMGRPLSVGDRFDTAHESEE